MLAIPVNTSTWAAGYLAEWLSLKSLPAEQAAFTARLEYHAQHHSGDERWTAREALACIRERLALSAVAGA